MLRSQVSRLLMWVVAPVVLSAQQPGSSLDWYNLSDPPLAISGPGLSMTGPIVSTYAGDALQGSILAIGSQASGGGNEQAQAWAWNGARWNQVITQTMPPLLVEPHLAYDAIARNVVLCGRAANSWDRPTWVFDGVNWTATGQQCNWEYGSVMTTSGGSGVLLFGTAGDLALNNGSTYLWRQGTWQYAGCNTNPLTPLSAAATPCVDPSGRYSPAIAWQPDLGKVFLFGGFGPPSGSVFSLSDLWTWDSVTGWASVGPQGTPPPANGPYGYKMVWDSANGYFLVVGHAPDNGVASGSTETRTFALKPDGSGGWRWEELNPTHRFAMSDYSAQLSQWALADYLPGGYVMALGTASIYDVLEPWVWATPANPLFNQPPVVGAGADQEVACVTSGSTPVTLHGQATDATPGSGLAFSWYIQPPSGAGYTVWGIDPTVSVPLGLTQAVLTVTDGFGLAASDATHARVTVQVVGLDPPLGPLVREGSAVPLPDKAVQAGRTLPFKLSMYCGGTQLTAADVAPPTIVSVGFAGSAPEMSVVASTTAQSGDIGLAFHSSANGWIYNFDTSRLGSGAWRVTIQMPDGLRYVAQFVLR
jgi:hypothetical protein